MGSGSFDPRAYAAFSRSTAAKPTSGAGGIFERSGIHKNLDPKGIKLRESRDSADNPKSTPIIVGIDVTGSMGMIADTIARKGLGVLFEEILKTKPVTDPHLMFMGIGDANCDRAPLQVSQFEADNRIVEQLTQIWIEHGGGGNNFESYNFPWYFAAAHTEHDSYIKRGKRGYLFTIGDEEAPKILTRDQIEEFCGDQLERDIPVAEMLANAQRTYDVFHIMIAEGSHARSAESAVRKSWGDLLGQHAIWLEDHTKLAETIVGAIEVVEGGSADEIRDRFGASVHKAVGHLPRSRQPRLALGA